MGGFRSTRARAQRQEGGATLVEFALILPVFAMLLFGMITAGLALNDKQEITHATREGARYARDGGCRSDVCFGNVGRERPRPDRAALRRHTRRIGRLCGTRRGPRGDRRRQRRGVQHEQPPTPYIANQSYPTTTNDNGSRVQVTATKPETIDLIVFGAHDITINVDTTAKSESNE